MNNQDQVPTIAELWKEAEFLIELTIPHYEGLANTKNRVSEERRPIYVAGLAKCKDKLESLRQQLLERTETEWGMQIREIISDGIPALRVIFDHGVLFLDSADSKDLGACLQFGSWELEQREKERKGD